MSGADLSASSSADPSSGQSSGKHDAEKVSLTFQAGANSQRLVHLMRGAVERLRLDLSGAVVLTEGASGAYVVTPILAALAGARQVHAMLRSTPYGSTEQVQDLTEELATLAGLSGKIHYHVEKSPELLAASQIITNSGHLRPIDADMIREFPGDAVISLMYEAWEFRESDLDLAACRERGIPVGGVNERHPDVGVFSYLGPMAAHLLLGGGIPMLHCTVLLVCDNPFGTFIRDTLRACGANVVVVDTLKAGLPESEIDAVLMALNPAQHAPWGSMEAIMINTRWPGAVVAQFWGDLDRQLFAEQSLRVVPESQVAPGHMGILPSAIGPDAIVRLQSGGLKVGEVLWQAKRRGASAEEAIKRLESSGYGEGLPDDAP